MLWCQVSDVSAEIQGFIKETVRPFDSRTFDFSKGGDTISDLLEWAEECEKRV